MEAAKRLADRVEAAEGAIAQVTAQIRERSTRAAAEVADQTNLDFSTVRLVAQE
jgi:hypothetical protein